MFGSEKIHASALVRKMGKMRETRRLKVFLSRPGVVLSIGTFYMIYLYNLHSINEGLPARFYLISVSDTQAQLAVSYLGCIMQWL